MADLRALAEVVAANPFPGAEPTQLLVGFLHEPPAGAVRRALDALDPAAHAPEAVVVRGRHLYLHLPNGAARAKLPPALACIGRRHPGSDLPLPGTTRGWRTVTRPQELLAP